MGLNWETKEGGSDYNFEESIWHRADIPWDEMVKETEYKHFTTFRKYHNCGGFYRIAILNWELDKRKGKLTSQRIAEGHRRK